MNINTKQLGNLLETLIPKKEPVIVVGTPGVGKTDVITQVAKKLKADLIVSHPVVSDPTDYKGFPIATFNKDQNRDEAHFLPFGDLQKLIDAKKLTIYFFDDFGQAPPSVQAACFPAKTPVMCKDGLKNIEDIKVGDLVLDENGTLQPVTELFKRESSNFVELKSVGMLPIKCTGEHPILVMRNGRKRKYKKTDDGYKVNDIKYGDVEWAEAQTIKKGDYVAVPIPKGNIKKEYIELNCNGNVTKQIKLTPELAKLIGYYVGDGWYTVHEPKKDNHTPYDVIGFSLDDKYPELHDELTQLIVNCFDTKVFKCQKKGCTRIQFRESYFGQYLCDIAGNRSNNKRIPDFILYNQDINILSAFLQGYLATDGSRLASNGTVRGVQWGTTSKTLAYQLQLALARYGTVAPVKYHSKEGQIMICPSNGKEYKVQDSYVIQCSDKRIIEMLNEPYDSKRDVVWSFEYDGKLWTKVKSVNHYEDACAVYNIEVENSHTYTVNNVVVHNCMQLILGRRINGFKVSEHVVFVAATNRKQDKAGVSGILEPVKSRFTIINLMPDLEAWVAWALTNNIHPSLVGFVRFRPSLLNDFQPTADISNSPNPRTIATVSRHLSYKMNEELEYACIAGAAGEGFASEFKAFQKIYASLPDADVMLENPDKVNIPEELSTLYALCGAIAYRANKDNFENVCKIIDRLPVEFSVMLMKDCIVRVPEICKTQYFREWVKKNKDFVI